MHRGCSLWRTPTLFLHRWSCSTRVVLLEHSKARLMLHDSLLRGNGRPHHPCAAPALSEREQRMHIPSLDESFDGLGPCRHWQPGNLPTIPEKLLSIVRPEAHHDSFVVLGTHSDSETTLRLYDSESLVAYVAGLLAWVFTEEFS